MHCTMYAGTALPTGFTALPSLNSDALRFKDPDIHLMIALRKYVLPYLILCTM